MRITIRQASSMLAVYWAMVTISSRKDEDQKGKRQHTVDDILECLRVNIEPCEKPDKNTINGYLDYFERVGAVTYPYASRKGRRDLAQLNPYKIPPLVWRQKPSRTTQFEWGKKLDEPKELLNGQSMTIWKDGSRNFNKLALTDEMKTPLRKLITLITPVAQFIYESPMEVDFDQLIDQLHGQPLVLDGNSLKNFYRYILLQFLFTYPHDLENAPYIGQLERTQEMFRRSVSFFYPNLYAEIALNRSVIVLKRKRA